MARKKIPITAADKLRYFTDRSNAIHRKYLYDPLFFDQYEQFLDIWKDADSWIEEAQDAKRRLAVLKEM